jgi:hypothetical protein
MKLSTKRLCFIAGAFLVIALVVMIVQWILFPGHWWDIGQTLHHEDIALFFIAMSIGIGMALLANKTR